MSRSYWRLGLVCHAGVKMNVNQLVQLAAFPVRVPIPVRSCTFTRKEEAEISRGSDLPGLLASTGSASLDGNGRGTGKYVGSLWVFAKTVLCTR